MIDGSTVYAVEDYNDLCYRVRCGQYGQVVRSFDNDGTVLVRWFYDKPPTLMDNDEVQAI
jgi:hypothetical protein